MNILDDFVKQKSETKKYQLVARYLEKTTINSDIEKLKKLENNKSIKPYIKYIGGIGNSRALEFCVSKNGVEEKSIKTILYILGKLKEENKKISKKTINGMLNVAIIYEKEEIIDFLLNNPQLKEKINFCHNDYMIVKNMTQPNQQEERKILKKLIISKSIPLDEKTRSLIKKSKNQLIIETVEKIDLKDKIENKLKIKKDTPTKKPKI